MLTAIRIDPAEAIEAVLNWLKDGRQEGSLARVELRHVKSERPCVNREEKRVTCGSETNKQEPERNSLTSATPIREDSSYQLARRLTHGGALQIA